MACPRVARPWRRGRRRRQLRRRRSHAADGIRFATRLAASAAGAADSCEIRSGSETEDRTTWRRFRDRHVNGRRRRGYEHSEDHEPRPGGRRGAGGARPARRWPSTRSRSAPTGWPRPSTAASTRRSPTAPTRNTASRSPSCRAARRRPTRRCCSATRSSSTWAACSSAFNAVEQGVPVDRRRGDLPEGSAGPHRPSRCRRRDVRRPRQAADHLHGQGRLHHLLPVDEAGLSGLPRRAVQALHLQPGALPRRQRCRPSRAT